MLRNAVAVRHVAFEDLGSFEDVLTNIGCDVRYHDFGIDDFHGLVHEDIDLLIVLGGPIGVYEEAAYPFLVEEIRLLRARLAENRPTFGICLGAQLMATALGAAVRPTGIKEIGFAPLTLTEEGSAGPLRHLHDVSVLHWHGDMFDVPQGAARLAETQPCRNQAFAIGRNLLGVQFHAEADVTVGFERWLIGHASELAAAAIDPRTLRQEAERYGPALRDAGRAMFREWLGGLQL